jgi:hypothetical protein
MRRVLCGLLLVCAISGCGGATGAQESPVVLFVEAAQIQKDPQPGWYRVTDGWLARRLEYEQALQRDLVQCKEQLEGVE